MRATISWWDLAGSGQTVDSMRRQLREDGVGAWSEVPGLRLKFWVSDPRTDRWGAVMLWDDDADPGAPLPPNRAAELIGRPPAQRLVAGVEAVVEGRPAGRSADAPGETR